MAIDKVFDGAVDGIADNLFNSVSNSVSEIKAMQQRKAAENVQLVVQALKKIDADIREKYDGVTATIEQRVANIKDGRDGIDGKHGRDGINGKDGRDGKDGRNGRDGATGPRGFDGPKGADGKDGQDGEDGVSITDAHIDFDGSLIISLSSGRVINVGEVVAADIAEKIKVITNGGGTSQTVLDTLTSLQNQINAIISGLSYQGTWNASTNTPTLTSSVGTSNYYYIVSVSGSTNLNGITDWQVGDWAIFNGSVWQKIDQSNLVTSVAGRTGAVTLTTADIGGLGTIATQAANNVSITGGSITGITDLAVADGGTGASTASGARTNLGLGTMATQNASSVAITGGTINFTSIGVTTPDIGKFSGLTVVSTMTLTDQTALSALALDAGKNVISVTNTGSGNNVLANSPTLVTPILGTPASGNFSTGSFTWPTFNQNTTGVASNVTGTVAISNGGTGQTTANAALNALLPTQTGNASKYLQTDGTNTSWDAISLSTSDITGTLGTANGGTGLSSFTSGGVVYASSTSALTTGSALTFNGTTLTLGGNGSFESVFSGNGLIVSKTNVGAVNAIRSVSDTSNILLINDSASGFANTAFYSSGSEAMRLTSTGLGIGTSSPTEALEISRTANPKIRFVDVGNIDAKIGIVDSTAFGFEVNGSERARIDSSGNLGIGTSSPSVKLDVYGSDPRIQSYNSSGPKNILLAGGTVGYTGMTTNHPLAFIINDTERLRIDTSGNLGIGSTSPASALYVKRTSGNSGIYTDYNGTNVGRIEAASNGNLYIGLTTGSGDISIGNTANANALILNSLGNLGLGITPSRWFTNRTAIQFGASVGAISMSNGYEIGLNFYVEETTAAEKRVQTGYSNKIYADAADGDIRFATGGTGAAGSSITWSERMRLTTAGNFGIGTSSPGDKLEVYSTITARASSGTSALRLRNSTSDYQWQTVAGTNAISLFDNAVGSARLTLDSSGNLGLGVTPSAWQAALGKVIQLGTGSAIVGDSGAGRLRSIANAYFDGTNWRYIVDGYATYMYQNGSTGETSWQQAASGTAGNAITFTQAMTLDASGNLGVGTTSPNAALELSRASADVGLFITRTGSGAADYRQFIDGGGDIRFNMVSSYNMRFFTADTERARIDSSGNLLVGTTSTMNGVGSDGKIGIQASGASGNFVVQNSGDDNIYLAKVSGYSNSTFIRFSVNGSGVGSVTTNGTNTTYGTSSDYRLKNTIAPMTGALAKVALLKPCTYKWNADGSNGEGFIAHELAEVCPDAVVGEKDAVDANGKIKPQGIDTSFLVATLTAAIQEQQAIIESLKARLDAANL